MSAAAATASGAHKGSPDGGCEGVDGGEDADDATLAKAARAWASEQASQRRGSLDILPGAGGMTGSTVWGRAGVHREVTLTWHDVRYVVYPNGEKKPSREVLKGLTGAALPHHVMALMGPTGSGKTSLLNVLSGRVPSGGVLAGEVRVNAFARDLNRHALERAVPAESESSRSPCVSGCVILANGALRAADFQQRVAYVMQEELLFAFLSVEETLVLHARLRLPPTVEDAEKRDIVQRVLVELGLKNVADSPVGRVGGFPRGLSGGERKRCNIAVEMVRNPAAIFLDEPTSGLDSFQAQNVMGALRDLARYGRSVVCTIHQPRSSIFGRVARVVGPLRVILIISRYFSGTFFTSVVNVCFIHMHLDDTRARGTLLDAMFDQLMLLTDGRLAYIGDAHGAVGYFETLQFKCPNLTNPADFFMDITSVDHRSETRETNSRCRVTVFAAQAQARRLGEAAAEAALRALDESRGGDVEDPTSSVDAAPAATTRTHASWLYQFRLLLVRAFKCQRRDIVGVGITYFVDILYALLLAGLYRGVSDNQEGVQNRLGCLFFIVLNLAYSSALPSINLFAGEKDIVLREQASGAYSTSAYYLSKLVAEFPKLSSKLVFCTMVYWIVGFNPDPIRYVKFVVIILCEVLAAQAVGMVMATGMPIGAALALGPACITVFTLFGGIYLNMDSIPDGAGWVRYVDFIYYAFSALCVNEFGDPDSTFACESDTSRCLPDGSAVLELYSFESVRVGPQIALQLVLAFGCQLAAFWQLVRSTDRYIMPLLITAEKNETKPDQQAATAGNEDGASPPTTRA